MPLAERVLFIHPSALEMCVPRLPWGTMGEEREWRIQKRRREQRGGWTADQVGSVWAPPPGGAGTRILRSGDCVVGVWGKERWTPSDEGQRPPEAA